MEFAEVRPYQPGDDVRTIDWRVTARMQKPYTKLFQEERERPVFILVDQRSGMFFGSQQQFKSVFAAKLATCIAWAAQGNQDRVGALIFGDQEQADLRAKRSQHVVLDFIHKLSQTNQLLNSPIAKTKQISLQTMLTETNRVIRPGSLVFLLSDFHDFNADCIPLLSTMAKRSDVKVFQIYDQLEQHLPEKSMLAVSDGQNKLLLDTASVGAQFEALFAKRQSMLAQSCLNSGARCFDASTHHVLETYVSDVFAGSRRSHNTSAA